MSSSDEPMIEVKGLSKRYRLGFHGARSLRDELELFWHKWRYGKQETERSTSTHFWALDDINFSIKKGEVIGLIGRNGAGKSTLLKILSRITAPTKGEITLRGRVASLLEVGTGFHQELSGRENVFLNGAMLGMKQKEIAAIFDQIVEFAEIEQFIDTPVKRYSSGMYVRLAFAVAAHLQPEILIIDEVLAVGDANFQRKCLGRIKDISESGGRTVLFVSHSMPSIRRLCNRCAVLESGKLLGIFPAEEAITYYNRNIGPSGTEIDLRDHKRDWGTEARHAKLLSIKVTSGTHLHFGEAFSIDVEIEVYEPIEGLMLGFAMNTIEGTRLMTLDSDAEGQTLTLPTGRHHIQMSLDRLPVHPGRYYCNLALGIGNHFLDIIDGFALWEVHTGPNDHESDRGFGGCRLTPKVTHHRP